MDLGPKFLIKCELMCRRMSDRLNLFKLTRTCYLQYKQGGDPLTAERLSNALESEIFSIIDGQDPDVGLQSLQARSTIMLSE